jgi:hypothetical protein
MLFTNIRPKGKSFTHCGFEFSPLEELEGVANGRFSILFKKFHFEVEKQHCKA